ncbi:oligosaccharide flippase family protein [Planococcus sp. ISL-109]|uniref:lipopolysaccharide biosynthesis protein n=1 Tax=Planococcus sp. ISL-109 TaxID=2819166 RepID=UPI001BE834A9|nr:oligosaccharide flippase family protein [Planococcus sp. ISL-109]
MRKKFSIYLLGNLMFGLSQWLTIIILTKTITMSEVGYYSLAIAYAGPILMLLSFGLKTIYITNENSEKKIFLINRLITFILFINLFIIILIPREISHFEFQLMVLVALIKGFEFIQEILFAFRQKEMRFEAIGKLKLAQSIGSIVITSYLFIDSSKILTVFLFILIFNSLLIIFELRNQKLFCIKEIAKKFKKEEYYETLKLCYIGLPLGLTLAISSLNTNIPRIILEFFSGIEELGYFSSLMFFYSAGTTIMFSISGFLLPIMVNKINNLSWIRDIFKKISIVYIFFSLLLLIIIYYFGDIILLVIYNEEFSKYHFDFFIIIIGAVFTYYIILMDIIFNVKKLFNFLLIVQILTIIVISIIGIFIVAEYSLSGAAIAFSCGIIFQFLIKFIYFMKIITKN